MSWVRNAVAVAAAIVAFFFIATPVANSDLNTQSMSQLQHQLLYKLIPQDTNMIPAEPIIEKSENAEFAEIAEPVESAEPAALTKTEASSGKSDATPTYYVIVASQVKMSNAEILVEKMHKQGFKEAKVFVHNNIIRVMCGEYQSESEAYRKANKLSENEDYYDAWVLKIKD